MHYWGDDWFKEHGDNLHAAIDKFEERIRKWAKCGVCGKEKYGTYRDDFFTMWDGSWTEIFFGYKCVYRKWYERIVLWLDYRMIPIRKTKYGWLKAGLADFNRKIGIVKLVQKWQEKMLNKAAQITCKEYPDVVDELLMDICFYECIKPCKWGNIDGKKIHNKYWKTVEPKKEE